jgi:8-oxo-dGTP diphosphatase
MGFIIEDSKVSGNLMKHIPYVSVIVENMEGEILLLLRDNRASIDYPNHWTLVGGKVEDDETPEMAAHRELEGETGLRGSLAFWKRYEIHHPLIVVDQHIYTGRVDAGGMRILGQDLQFFKPTDMKYLKIGYGFDALLQEYLLSQKLV